MERLSLSDIDVVISALNDQLIKYELAGREFFKINDLESVEDANNMQKYIAGIIVIFEAEKKERQRQILTKGTCPEDFKT